MKKLIKRIVKAIVSTNFYDKFWLQFVTFFQYKLLWTPSPTNKKQKAFS